jgi:TnsA endonuclease N terminal
MAYKGRFSPSNSSKYIGDPTNIIYRSLWELKLMKYLDTNPNVLAWGSEELAIKYVSPLDNRVHRYFPDFICKVKQTDGTTKVLILEVKPKKQTKEPKVPKKRTRRFLQEVMTWGVNSAKWKAAQEYCADRGWEFRIITENELDLK